MDVEVVEAIGDVGGWVLVTVELRRATPELNLVLLSPRTAWRKVVSCGSLSVGPLSVVQLTSDPIGSSIDYAHSDFDFAELSVHSAVLFTDFRRITYI